MTPRAAIGIPLASRLARLLMGFLLLAAATFTPSLVRPVAAIDCSAVYCAWLEIVPGNGSGSGSVVSDPYGIDCRWSGSRSGTCLYQFSWGHFVSGGIDVDLYLDADEHSYVCYQSDCTELGRGMVKAVHLNPGNDIDVFPVFNAGSKTTVSLRGAAGTGSGRVTTSPGGLDCRIVAGQESGTCSADYWYIGSSNSVTLHRTPDSGSYACSQTPACQSPGTDYVSTLNMSPGLSAPPAEFWLAVPLTVSITGSGTVNSDPSGISCPPTCSKWFAPDNTPDEDTRLTATPAPGWYLKDWTGAACGATTGATCTFYMGNTGPTVGVVFARLATPAPSQAPTQAPTRAPSQAPRPTATTHPIATSEPGQSAATPATPAEPTAAAGSEGPVLGPDATVIDATAAPASPVASEAAAADPGATPAPSAAAAPRVDGSVSGGSPDPAILVATFLIGMVVLLAIGFAIGRRRPAATSDVEA